MTHKPFSLFTAILIASVGTMFAAEGDIAGRIVGDLTGGTPMITNGLNVNSNRGGFAVKEDGVFFCNGATGHMLKAPLDLSAAPVAENDSIGTGFYMDFDDAGHIVIYAWTIGSATMDVAQVYDADYNLLRNDTLRLNGRCDMPTLAGNMVEGRGAYFTASNSAKAVLRHNLVDGVLTSIDTIPSPVAHGGNSSVAPLDVDHFYVQSRGNALYYVDMSGEAPVVTNMPFFGENTFTSAYGGKAFKMAGHTLYVMGTYKVGGYLGSFAVFDVTDPANPYQIADEASTMGTSAMGTACVTFRVVMGDQVAHIYEYACYAVREYDLTVSSATFIKQNAEGEEWQAMKSDNGMLVLKNQIYKGADILMNSAAEDEGARTFAAADIIFDGTVVAKDTIDFIYDPAIDSLTIHLVGTFVPCIDFAVTVPEGTPNCYITGNFNNWGFTRMVKLDNTHYKYKYVGTAALTENVQYKYACGADWAYVEKAEGGADMTNRSWAETDVVASWASIPILNTVTYELNGGVTNDYGWKTKGELLLDLQTDINADLGKSYTWAKMEDGIVYYNLNGTWTKETAAEGIASTVTGFVYNTTYNTTEMLKTYISVTKADKYGWLKDVIVAARTAADLAATDYDLSENIYRKELSAFFLNSPADPAWPVSASYEAMGTLDAFQPIWKHGFANPATVIDPFVLNRPYYAGMTFDGWYAQADFSGEKVTSIDANTSGTLYAKWVEYIPTLAEVIAMADNTNTKAKGVVTYISGKNAYIQDASAGMLLYLKNNPSADFVVGKEVVVKGTRTTYGGAPEIKNVEEVRAENGTMPKALSLATLAAATADPLKYFGQLIAFKGLTIVALDNYKNPSLTDGVDTVACYKMSVDDALFPVGSKVDVTAIAGYFNGFQLVGDVAGITHAIHSDDVPPDAVLANYYDQGNVCVCFFVPANMACNDIVVTGSFNGWSSTIAECAAAEAVEGYDGWYVASFEPEAEPSEADGICAKPIILDIDGNFNWEYQIGAATAIRGGVQVVQGAYAGEIDLKHYGTDAPNVFTVDAWKSNPCTAVYHNYTVTVVSDGCGGYVVPFIVGGMNGWSFQQMQYSSAKTVEYGGVPTYEISFKAAEGTPYQIVSGKLNDSGEMEVEPGWNDDSYMQMLVDGAWVRIPGEDGDNFLTHENANIVWDLRKYNLQWARCNESPAEYEHGVVYLADVANYIDFQALSESDPAMTSHIVTSTNPYELANGSRLVGFVKADGTEAENKWNVKETYNYTLPTPTWEGVDSLKVGTMFRAAAGTTIELGAFATTYNSQLVVFYQPNGDSERGVEISVYGEPVAGTNLTGSGVKIDGIRPAYAGFINLPAGSYDSGDVVIKIITNTTNIFGVAITAFKEHSYQITTNVSPDNSGHINNVYNTKTNATLNAIPNYGYHFAQWSDGVTENPRTIALTKDTIFTAEFAKNPVITYIYDQNKGIVYGETTLPYEAAGNVTFKAIPNDCYRFTQWNDGNTDNPRSIYLDKDTTITAEFEQYLYTNVKIGDMYYDLNIDDKTATVLGSSNGASTVSVTDRSIAEWNNLPQEYVFEANCPADGYYPGLKKVKVYADQYYINVQVEYDPEEIIDRAWTPFHFYFNTDNSDATGGYDDLWNDANVDILMEGAVFADGTPCAYEPDVFAWTGEVGGTGWSWEGLTASAAFVTSQHVGNVIEFQFIRELIPTPQGAAWNADEFGIGFEIQQNWEAKGVLPCASPTHNNPTGKTAKLQVRINKNTVPSETSELNPNLVIPSSVTYNDENYAVTAITSEAFKNHTEITSVEIPTSMTYIAYDAFEGCDSITSVVWNAKNCYSYRFGSQVESFVFGNEVEVIPSGLCEGMYQLTTISIPNSVRIINDYAFFGCNGLTSIVVPDGVTSIGYEAFANCSNLTHLYIPATVEYIAKRNLVMNKQLTHLTAPASIFVDYEGGDGYYYDDQYYANSYFSENGSRLPNKLDTLIINRGELEVYGYGTIALSNKTLRHMDLSAVENTELQDEAFAHFYNLRSLVLPQGLEKINYMAIANCKSLESITIPASVTEIGMSAFEDCRSLLSVNFASGSMLTKISDWAFYNCHELQSINIPEGVTEIGKAAFFDCVYLNDVIVPASVQAIGDNAFALCARMQQMRVKAVVPPSIASKTFEQVSREMPVYVPMNSVNAYKADPLWGEMNIIGVDEQWDAVDNITTSTVITKQLINGQLYIIRDGKTYTAQGQEVK